MYKEFRGTGFLETISSTSPEAWGQHFAKSKGLSTYTKLSFALDERWKLIKKFLNKNSLILDAGCGAGEWVEFLNKNGYKADGLDYSKELINSLNKHKSQYKWVAGDILNLPIAENTYDGIISWGVIEHNEEGPSKAIQEFYRVLKKGGIAIITVPNDCEATREASEQLFPQNVVKEKGGSFFQYYLTPDEMRGLFERAGFKVKISKSLGGPSLALVFPKLYAKVLNSGLLFRTLNLAVKIFIPKTKKYDHNIICIAEK